MAPTIASDRILTAAQQRTLPLLLDMIIPPDSGRGMPGAGELNFIGYVAEFAADSLPAIRAELDLIDDEANEAHGALFADLSEDERRAVVERLRANHTGFAQTIVVEAVRCYYQDDRVVAALGMRPGAPFPEGYEVASGDLTLLDPVRQMGRLYREV